MDIDSTIRSIIESNRKGVLAITGGGTGAIYELVKRGRSTKATVSIFSRIKDKLMSTTSAIEGKVDEIISDVITTESTLSLKDELDRLPFSYDPEAKNDFMKIEKNNLPKMEEMGWEWLTTDRTINYRMNWTPWYGLREFVQNSLDETGDVDITYDANNQITYVKDNGEGFRTKHLLLGQHKGYTEEEKHLTRGCFGEGMKLAALPFFRAGCKVFIRTVGLDIVFAMGPFDEHYVHYTFKRPNNHKKGTHIAITNFDGSEYKSKFTPFISKEKIVFTRKGGPRKYDENKIRQVLECPGDIYVRDIHVMNTSKGYDNAFFGYNFWFDHNSDVLDPDRNSIKNPEYIKYEFEYIISCNDVEFLTKYFRRISTPNESLKISDPRWSFEHNYIRGDYMDLTKAEATAVFEAIKTVFGTKDFTWSSNLDEGKALEHLHILDLTHKLPNLLKPLHKYKMVSSAQEWIMLKDLKHTCDITEEMVKENFGEKAAKQMTLVQDIFAEVTKSCSSYNSGVNFFWSIKPSHEVDKIGGFYTHSKRQISIKINRLKSFHSLLFCFIHELGHALSSGAKDISEDFERGLVDAGFYTTTYFGKKPEKLKELRDTVEELGQHDWKSFKIDVSKAEITLGETKPA